MTDLFASKSAILSDCGTWRWRLERVLGETGIVIAFLLVNPSTADAEVDDQTVLKGGGFSARLGARKFIFGNKFGFRAKDVKALKAASDPVGPDNDKHLEQIMRDADLHIVAWGPLSKLPPKLRGRWREVLAIADKVGCPLHCLGVAGDGHPRHPLMLAYATELVPWKRPAA